MARTTQKDRVLAHLEESKSITSWEAIREYGCTRLADVVYKLKKEGHLISTDNVTSINRFGDKVTYAKYKYIGEKSLT